jgi:hypothetical protein
MLDLSMGQRAKWLADEQAAGNGTVVFCGMCAASGFDPDDPSDNCPACRGVGAVLRTDLRPDIFAPAATTTSEPVILRFLRGFLGC